MKLLCTAVLAASLTALFAASSGVSAQQASVVRAFTGMRLFDATDRAPIDNATLVVRNGRIIAAGRPASRSRPAPTGSR